MGHGKETPRQKMIGMMYLVLMAMLALNVSNEVLDAFDVLDEGLKRTIETIDQTNSKVIKDFGLQYELNKDVTLGAAYEYMDLGDAKIDRTGGILRGDLKGDYKKNQIHFIGVNLVWKF